MTGNVDNSETDLARARLVDRLAHSVIEVLNASQGGVRRARIAEATNLMYQGSCQPGGTFKSDVFSELRRLRIKDPDVIDDCIADAARQLGDDWLSDTRSFSEVALASSRLLDLCRETDRTWDNVSPPAHRQSLIVATFHCEMHLIGSAILAKRLRRLGHSVSLMCNATADDLSRKLSAFEYDGIMISSGSESGLETVAKSIKHIHQNIEFCPPIAVGGAVTEFIRGEDVPSIGADLVTNDEKAALGVFEASMRHLRVRAAQ